jgi:glycosyltransferase involved in cell wall biosynthesis
MVFSFFSFEKPSKTGNINVPVSVIICAKNEAENIKKNLPFILEQKYPNFEVVLINDASSDDTLEIFEHFAEKHSTIKIVNVENNEAFWGNKKYALTLGIKAASHEHLLFTDADCKPKSKYWVQQMCNHFTHEKSLILGYGAYKKKKNSFLNLLIRFETLLTAIQYISYAKIGSPFMGVGRNLAYTKSLFFEANGFIEHMKIRSGDDDLFVNQIGNKKNTAFCINSGSFTISEPETTFRNWIRQKRRHVSTAKHYKKGHQYALGLFFTTNLLFYILAILLLLFLFQWIYVLIIIGIKYVIQFIVYYSAAKKLKEKDTIYVLPILEVSLILSQLIIAFSNIISKPTHWK